jgi:membrane protein involved in colicin uptake
VLSLHFASGEPRVKPIRKNIVPLAFVFLCALLSVAGCSKKTQEKTQQTIDDAKAAAASAAQDAKQQASDAADKAKQQASDAAQKAGEKAQQSASDAAAQAMEAAKEKAMTLPQKCKINRLRSRQAQTPSPAFVAIAAAHFSRRAARVAVKISAPSSRQGFISEFTKRRGQIQRSNPGGRQCSPYSGNSSSAS